MHSEPANNKEIDGVVQRKSDVEKKEERIDISEKKIVEKEPEEMAICGAAFWSQNRSSLTHIADCYYEGY